MTAHDDSQPTIANGVPAPERGRFPLLMLLPAAVFLLLGAMFFWGLWNKDDRLPSTLIGKPIPEFSLPPIEGRENGLSSANLRGEVSIVNVWASWCVPCRVEMPLLVELAATGSVPIHGINFRDDPRAAREFLLELGDPYLRIGADRNGRVSIDWGVYGLPETFVIDARGRIAYKHVGPFNRRSLEEDILPVVRRLQAEGGS
jgi:cytochrome c biogenesis protein CcmG/thiol:disulfide interchange protein DsbE